MNIVRDKSGEFCIQMGPLGDNAAVNAAMSDQEMFVDISGNREEPPILTPAASARVAKSFIDLAVSSGSDIDTSEAFWPPESDEHAIYLKRVFDAGLAEHEKRIREALSDPA